jgi:hypothetical protein
MQTERVDACVDLGHDEQGPIQKDGPLLRGRRRHGQHVPAMAIREIADDRGTLPYLHAVIFIERHLVPLVERSKARILHTGAARQDLPVLVRQPEFCQGP